MDTKTDEMKIVRNTSEGETKNVFILSLSFMFVFTAYLALQNLQSSLNQEEGLGVIALSCLYGCIIISAILAPTVLKLLGIKLSLIVAWIIHCLYTISNFYPTFYTLIPTSVLLGLISGPLWTSQSVYISTYSYTLAERTSENSHAVLSRMNGIFFTMYETTQITGNLISSLILNQGTGNESLDGNISTSCGANDCPVMSTTNVTQIAEPDESVVYILLSVFLVFDIVGLGLTAVYLPRPSQSSWSEQSSTKDSVISCMSALSDIKLVMLVPFIAFMAMEQAVLWTDITKSYISCPVGIGMVGYVMASYGGATTVSALITSRAAEHTGRHILFALAFIINLVIFIIVYIWKPDNNHLLYIFLIVVFWGFSEGIWQTQSNALIALFFPEKKEPAFANYHCWKATSFTIYFVISNFLCVNTKLILVMTLLVLAMILYWMVEWIAHKGHKRSSTRQQ